LSLLLLPLLQLLQILLQLLTYLSGFSLTHFPSVPPQAALYAVRWYFGQEEFYRYVPREAKPTFVFAVAGINVDVS